MGSFLLAAGAQGKRYALPNSEIMIHQPAISGGASGPASDIKIISDHMQKNRERLNLLLAQNTGRTIDEINRDTDRDYFMTAEEAKDYGIIDSVIQHRSAKVK
jgi:ATP-dependent Clp protease protease subunit